MIGGETLLARKLLLLILALVYLGVNRDLRYLIGVFSVLLTYQEKEYCFPAKFKITRR